MTIAISAVQNVHAMLHVIENVLSVTARHRIYTAELSI